MAASAATEREGQQEHPRGACPHGVVQRPDHVPSLLGTQPPYQKVKGSMIPCPKSRAGQRAGATLTDGPPRRRPVHAGEVAGSGRPARGRNWRTALRGRPPAGEGRLGGPRGRFLGFGDPENTNGKRREARQEALQRLLAGRAPSRWGECALPVPRCPLGGLGTGSAQRGARLPFTPNTVKSRSESHNLP